MNPTSRLRALIVFSFALAASAFALPSTIPTYNPQTKIIQGSLPFTPLPTPDPSFPVNPYTLTITSPIGVTYPLTVNIQFSIATVGNVVGGIKVVPAGVLDAVALSYVSASPATLTFTAPNQTQSTIISVKIDPIASLLAVTGDYGYVIKENWPAAVVDPGATINLTVAPAEPAPILPTISNLTPADGSFFTYDPPTTGPVSFPINFDANVATSGTPITSLTATIDGDTFNGQASYHLTGALLPDLQRTGLQTNNAHGTVTSPNILDGGPHTITVSAQNNAGFATATTVINVRTPPAFTSVGATTFTIGQSNSFNVTAIGFPAPTLALTGGTLPAGVTFNPTTGVLSGSPTSTSGSPVTLIFTATNVVRAVPQTFTLTIKGAPTLTWATPAAIPYGTALTTTQLNATAGLGTTTIPGTYAYTPAAGTVLSAGTRTLNVVFTPTNTTDYAPLSGSVSIVVNKAPLNVTAGNASKVYGTANPSFTAMLSGFVNGDTASAVTGSAVVASATTTTSAVGSYSITPSIGTLASVNYTFNFISGTLSVTKAPLTVTAKNATRAYGVANPSFSPTISGFVNGNTVSSSVTGTAALSTTATTTSPVGSYPITAALGSLASGNYSFVTFVPGTLAVTKANQAITFGTPPSKQVGDATFTLLATASSSLAVSYTSSNPAVATVSGSTVTILAAGTTTITASQAGNTNFNAATPVARTLTVTAAQTCPTTVMWLPPVSLNQVQQDGSVVPIKFFLQQYCHNNNNCDDDDDDDDHHGCDDDGWHDSHHSGHDYDHSGSNVSCHHSTNGRSTSDSSCHADCDHDDSDDDGCANLRDKSVIISIYEVGSSAPATQYKYGTGSANPPDYIIDGDYKYQLNFPTAHGTHRYHIDIYRFPPGSSAAKLVGSKEFSVR